MKADLQQFEFVDLLLRSIVLDVEHHYGVEFTLKSIYRIGDPGVHGTLPVRGLDVGCPDYDFGKLVEKYTNAKYQYDPDRPHKKVCLYHNAGTGYHLHFQTYPETIVINQ